MAGAHDRSVTLLITKYAVTGFVIVRVSELAKRSDRLGAGFFTALRHHHGARLAAFGKAGAGQELSNHAFYTFRHVSPGPAHVPAHALAAAQGDGFLVGAVLWCALLTFVCFVITALIAKRFGVELFP